VARLPSGRKLGRSWSSSGAVSATALAASTQRYYPSIASLASESWLP
jgi:hypothetical protein